MPLPPTTAASPALAVNNQRIVRTEERVKPRCYNRIRAILVHTAWYSIEGPARLATDIGVSRSTVCRIMSGRNAPSFRMAQAITDALEQRLNRSLDLGEVFSDDGTYPTASCCSLCGCHNGCMPDAAYDHRCRLKPEYRTMKPGDWSLSPASASRRATTISTNLISK